MPALLYEIDIHGIHPLGILALKNCREVGSEAPSLTDGHAWNGSDHREPLEWS